MYFIDKYRPNENKKAHFHKDILDMLQIMSEDDAIPHIIMYGPNGSGKKTTINMMLGMLFGKQVYNTKDVSYEVVGSGGKKTIEKVKQSGYHIVINPKNNNYDKYLIQSIVKTYVKTRPLNTMYGEGKQFKIVVINDLDNLSFCAQAALRRTMERYNDKCRFIMWCESLSNVLQPLQSRCLCIRIPAPSNMELFEYIYRISLKENMMLTLAEYQEIIKKSNGNIKTALWHLHYKKYKYECITKYDEVLEKLNKLLLEKTNYPLKNFYTIREMLSQLMITTCTSVSILCDIVQNKIFTNNNISDDVKLKIIKKSVDVEHNLIKGRRDIIHFDDFVIYCMYCVNSR